jgi:hypothetical protein
MTHAERQYRIYSNRRPRSSIGEWSCIIQRFEKVALFHQFHISAILEKHFVLFCLLLNTTNTIMILRVQLIPSEETRNEMSKTFRQ